VSKLNIVLNSLDPKVLILSFSFLIHLPGITSPLLDYHAYRQCQTASMSRNYLRHGMRFLQPELDDSGRPRRAGTEFPIYSYGLAWLYRLGGGIHEIYGRILSALFAGWGAVFLFELVRRRLGQPTALWSAMAMCVIPVHVYFTRTVQPEAMALWGLIGFARYLDLSLNEPRDRWRKLSLTIALGATAPLLKLPYLYVVVPLAAAFAWEIEQHRVRRLGQVAIVVSAIGLLTAAWYAYARTAPVGVLPLTAQEHWANLKPIFTAKLWADQFLSRLPELWTTYPGLVLGIFGAIAMRRQKALFVWVAWLGITALYILLLGRYAQIHRYTALPFAPICAVFIGRGIAELSLRSSTLGRRALVVLLIIGMPIHTALRIRHWYKLEYPWVSEARAIVAKYAQPNELIITNTAEHPVLLYHLDRYGFAPDLEETGLDVVKTYRAQGARVFFTPTYENWARVPALKDYFDRNARLVYSNPNFLIYLLP
jgi:hypothetical protein